MKRRSRMHMLCNQTRTQMMSFVIETSDGKLIVIDGGMPEDSGHLLETLRRLSGREVPRVDAWFLTHNHLDHTGALIELMNKQPGAFTIDKVYYNFPSVQFLTKYEPQSEKEFIAFREIQGKIAGAIETITQGDIYEIGEAYFEVMYTPDPTFVENPANNASTVLRMTLGGKKVLFLGDLGVEAGGKLLKMHGEGLKSDYVQRRITGRTALTGLCTRL